MPSSVLSVSTASLLALGLLLYANVANAAYRWVDESGSIHFVQYEYQVPKAVRESGRYEDVSNPTPSKELSELPPPSFSSTIMEFLKGREAAAPHYGFFEAAWKWASFHVLGIEPAPEDLVSGLSWFKTRMAELDALIAGHGVEIAGLRGRKREIEAGYHAAVRRMKMSRTDILKNARTWNSTQDLKLGIAQLNAKIAEHTEAIRELEDERRDYERRGARLLVPAGPFAILASGVFLLVLAGVLAARLGGLFDARRVPVPRLLLALLALYLAFVLKSLAGYDAPRALWRPSWVESVVVLAAVLSGRIAVSHLGSGPRVVVPTILAAVAGLAVTGVHAWGGSWITSAVLYLAFWAPTWALATGTILEAGWSGGKTFLFGLLGYAGASAVAEAATLSVIAGGTAALFGMIYFHIPDVGSIANAIVMTGLLIWVCDGIDVVAPRPPDGA